ncbi:cytochrome c biogenesis protein CcdA [Patescibacteria group bacterium AH-259-L07]|nr:cytochrome c biogenesis protein CcdA [Patescibacteria group bacterium AH-259-L07]
MNEALHLIIPAFIAGILTFLAPCTLPLVPAYLGFISGVSIHDLKNPFKAKKAKKTIFTNGLFFVIGFSAIFIFFGIAAGLIGQALVPYRIWLMRIGGILVIVFGFSMLGIINPVRDKFRLVGTATIFRQRISNGVKLPFFQKTKLFKKGGFSKHHKSLTSFMVGASFAFGWTGCVGPVLASILFLASTSTTVFQGGFLLLVFSLGLAIPFLIIAAGIGKASQYIQHATKYLHIISIIGGVFLIFLGLLLFTNNFSLLIAWGFKIFKFINYEALLDYL